MIPVIPIVWLLLVLVTAAFLFKPMREWSALVDHSGYVHPNGRKHTKPRLAKRCTVCNPKEKR